MLAPLVDKIIVVFVPIVECKPQVAITNSIGISSADASSDIVESDSHFVRCLINDFQVSPDSHAKFVITPFAPGGQEYSFAVFDWVDIGTSTDVPTWLRDGKYHSICTIKGNAKDQNMKQMHHDILTFEL